MSSSMDYSDPWRYVCPECGCATVQYRVNTDGKQMNGRVAQSKYYCNAGCGSIDGIRDKKTGEIIND